MGVSNVYVCYIKLLSLTIPQMVLIFGLKSYRLLAVFIFCFMVSFLPLFWGRGSCGIKCWETEGLGTYTRINVCDLQAGPDVIFPE